MNDKRAYPWTLAQKKAFKRDWRRIERMKERDEGSLVPPAVALAKLNEVITTSYGIVPPVGGRIYLVRAKVNPARPWDETVRGAGRDTPASSGVWSVGDQYPPKEGPVREREFILANFGSKLTPLRDAVAWGMANSVRRADARETLAVAECNPALDEILGMNPMYLLSLEECSFGGERRVPRAWWDGSSRGARLRWAGHGLNGRDWVVFSRE